MIKRFIDNLHYKLFKSYIKKTLGTSKAHDRLVIGEVTRILVDTYSEDHYLNVLTYISDHAANCYQDA